MAVKPNPVESLPAFLALLLPAPPAPTVIEYGVAPQTEIHLAINPPAPPPPPKSDPPLPPPAAINV